MTVIVYININFGFKMDRTILEPEVVVAACAPEVEVAPGAVAEVVGSLQNAMLRMWSVESVHCSFARKQLKHNINGKPLRGKACRAKWPKAAQNCHFFMLKMLGLYLYTLIIGHKSCNILSILNKLKM